MQVYKKTIIIFLVLFLLISQTNISLANYLVKNTTDDFINKPKQIPYTSGEGLYFNVQDYFLNDSVTAPIKLEARIDVPLELTLQKALEIAVSGNQDIRIADKNINLNKWKYYEKIGDLLPDYKLGVNWSRFDGTFLLGGVFPVSALTSNASAYMRLDYMVLDGGARIFNTLIANKLLKSSKENFSFSLNQTLLLVAKAYNNLLKEQADLEVLAKAVEEAKATLKLNKDLERQGLGTKFNVLQSEVLLLEQEQAFITKQASFRQASINLAYLLNLEQGTHIKPSINDLKVKYLFDTEKPIEEIISTALKNRPEVKKMEWEFLAKKNEIFVALSDYLPKTNLYAQYGGNGKYFFDSSSTSLIRPDAIPLDLTGKPVPARVLPTSNQTVVATGVSNVIRGGGRPYVVMVDESLMSSKFIGLEVNWEIGKGLGVTNFAKVKQVKSELETLKLQIEKLKTDVEKDVRYSYLNLQSSKRLIEVSEKKVESSKEALRLSKLRLENGIGINTEVLDAQKDYKESLASKVNAIISYNNAQADLLYKVGIISIDNLLNDVQ